MNLIVCAPFDGVVRLLDSVPDPAFSQQMVGQGLAIDPLCNLVRAPMDGEVIAIAPTRHSVTLRGVTGAELLIHIGIDTVLMGGDGFEALVHIGQMVTTGDQLIRFDLDAICDRARSAITPIVCGTEGARLSRLAPEGPITTGAPLFELSLLPSTAVDVAAPGTTPAQSTAHLLLKLSLANGIHARPAARIAALAREYAGQVQLRANGREANAASTGSLLALAAIYGDEIEIRAIGPDPRPVVLKLAALIDSGMGEDRVAATISAPVEPGQECAADPDGTIYGTPAAPGLAIGPAHWLGSQDQNIAEHGQGVAEECAALESALAQLRDEIAPTDAMTPVASEIAQAHLALIDDPDMLDGAGKLLATGKSAAFAWRSISREGEAALRASGIPRLAERAIDLRDIERRLIAILDPGSCGGTLAPPPSGSIILTSEILPSQLIGLPSGQFAAIVTKGGGPTSHAAILAASAGIPMIVAAGDDLAVISAGTTLIVDADRGAIIPAPDDQALAAAATLQTQRAAARTKALAAAQDECRMRDGNRIEIFANLASVADTADAVAQGAEGCGLLRTEFLFAERDRAPTEAEQAEAYGAVAAALQSRPLIIRTLDVGGDKPISYLPFPPEENPALGGRGIRHSLAHPDLLMTQLTAMVRAVPAAQLRIMLPMIVEPAEVIEVRRLLQNICAKAGITDLPQLGVMIETPAAAVLARDIAKVADFLSVGSNDLAQYCLAMDRGNPALAARADALHPAVLRLIGQAAVGARAHGRWFGICGGVASDPLAAPLLVGLGCNELSGTPGSIAAIKQRLRHYDMNACRALVDRALDLGSAAEVRQMLQAEG